MKAEYNTTPSYVQHNAKSQYQPDPMSGGGEASTLCVRSNHQQKDFPECLAYNPDDGSVVLFSELLPRFQDCSFLPLGLLLWKYKVTVGGIESFRKVSEHFVHVRLRIDLVKEAAKNIFLRSQVSKFPVELFDSTLPLMLSSLFLWYAKRTKFNPSFYY